MPLHHLHTPKQAGIQVQMGACPMVHITGVMQAGERKDLHMFCDSCHAARIRICPFLKYNEVVPLHVFWGLGQNLFLVLRLLKSILVKLDIFLISALGACWHHVLMLLGSAEQGASSNIVREPLP